MRHESPADSAVARAADAGFALLLAAPLLGLPGMGPDTIRLPAAAALVTLLSVRVAWSAARRGESGVRGDPVRTAMLGWFVAGLVSLFAAVDAWSGVFPLVVLGIGISAYLFVTSGTVSRGYLNGPGSVVLAVVGLSMAVCLAGQRALGKVPSGTVGNSNLAGALAAMLFPFALARALGPSKRLLYGSAAVALAAAVVLTQARGAAVAMLVGGIVVGAAAAWRRWRARAIVLGAAALVVAAGAATPLLFGRSDTARVRLGLWRGAFALFRGHPVVGCGAGNFGAQFPPYRTEEEFRLTRTDEAESAHSTWLQILAETGVPGLLAFLLLVYVAARLWRYYVKTAEDEESCSTVAGAGGGAAAFLVASFFYTLHTETSHLLMFFLFLGMSELLGNTRVRMRRAPATQARFAAYGALVILGIFATMVTVNRAAARRTFLEAMRETDPERRASLLAESRDANYREWRTHAEMARTFTAQGRWLDAATSWKNVLDHRPHHVEALNGIAVSRRRAGEPVEQCEGYLERAARIAPFFYKTFYNRGMFRAEAEDWTAARAMFSESIRCNPGHARSYLYRGLAALRQGDRESARSDFRRARELEARTLDDLKDDVRKDPYFEELF